MLPVSAPFGDLTLPDGDGPLLLASAGIGGTPMLAMLHHLADTGSSRQVVAVHADRSPADHAHGDELRRLVGALPHAALHLWYEEADQQASAVASASVAVSAGRADIGGLPLPEGITAYLCGPLPFMRTLRGDLLRRGVPPQAVHYEVFGPDLWLTQQP